jgi:Na+/H+-dicarboxylate symporter
VSASLVSLVLGLVLVNVLQPGAALNLPLPGAGASSTLRASSLSLKEFTTHLVPRSVFDAMAPTKSSRSTSSRSSSAWQQPQRATTE